MHGPAKLRVGWKRGWAMAAPYAGRKLKAQAAAILPIALYLMAVRVLVLGMPLLDGLSLALGIAASALGLAAFLEGLFLAIMPLGEAVGMALPRKAGILPTLAFALLLGAGATLAEPAIGFLKTAGSDILPWRAPLLYHLLNRGSGLLILAICAGVGLAVALGLLRFLRLWSFKALLPFVILPIIIASAAAAFHPQLRQVLGLAWDSGGVTTGPVTVPLILALGLGMTRASGSGGSTEGLGVVTLASALPVLAVLALGLFLSPALPAPAEPQAFFAEGNRQGLILLFGDQASVDAQALAAAGGAPASAPDAAAAPLGQALFSQGKAAFQSVLPLALLLILVLLLCRAKVRQADEVALGLGLALAGMFLFNAGMEGGLAKLGRQAGSSLPATFTAIPDPSGDIVIRDFDPNFLETALEPSGRKRPFFWLDRGSPRPVRVDYEPARFDPGTGEYRFRPSLGPRFPAWGGRAGISVLVLLVFILGWLATIAEPSLAALGETVEEMTVGTFRKSWLVTATAVGVGLGTAAGALRLILDLPLMAILLPAYALILVLTLISRDDMAALAWDSAGVTTGPVTVPLVIALGLGLGGARGVTESFGILACASAFPVAAVLGFGLVLGSRQSQGRRP